LARSDYPKQTKSFIEARWVDFPLPGNVDIYRDYLLQITWSSTQNGGGFTNSLFPQILYKGKTIKKAFDYVVDKDTSLLNRFFRKGTLTRETPQLKYQNADPSRLFLMPYLPKQG